MKNRTKDEQPVTRTPDNAQLAQRLTSEQMKSLAEYGTEQRLEAGEYLFDEKSVVDSFYVVLEGEIRISRLASAGETPVGTHRVGDFTGQLVTLAGRTSVFRARATFPSRVLEISSETFRRVAAEQPDVADIFVSGLGRRMRYAQRTLRQQEKMAALGKLSAGLAHELNNPAAAARRAAAALREESLKAQRHALAYNKRFTPAQREHLAALEREVTEGSSAPVSLDPLERSDKEDELADWFEDHGVPDGWELAPALAAAGLAAERLGALTEGPDVLRGETLAGALEWLGATLTLVTLADEVGQSTRRVSELVQAMKEYSHMDKSTMGEVDVRDGLESTLTILAHKLKKGVTVEREYAEGLPRIWAHGGELNQVWINIIDNAVDAMDGHGKLKVKTSWDEDHVLVEIIDDGPGIPREVKSHIFEPFFTTKGVGEGTGLGLDIVRRIVAGHSGEIRVDSAPGETSFRVRLPINGPQREPAKEAYGQGG
jgi:signal transduction histidine kinase